MTTTLQAENPGHATLSIGGMTCASCAASVQRAAARLPGVAEVAVSLARGRANVTFDPARISADSIAGAIQHVGYTATVQAADAHIELAR